MLFKQLFKIGQGTSIWQGLDSSFNNFQEDRKSFVHRMQRILRQDCHKCSIREGHCESSPIIPNFQILGKIEGSFLKKIRQW